MPLKPGESAPESPAGGTPTDQDQQTAASSPAPSEAVTPEPTTGTDGNDGVKKPGSSLEALMAARELITQDAETAKSAKPEAGESPDSETAIDEDQKADDGKDKPETESGPESKKDANTRIRQLNTKVNELSPKAEVYDKLYDYMTTRNIEQEDFEKGMGFIDLFKNNPHEAYKQFKPVWEQLQRFVGDILPDDLAQKVEAGTIDEDTAHELAEQRSRAISERSGRERVEQNSAIQREAQEIAQLRRANANAVHVWEAGVKSRDPDYERKQPFVTDTARVLVAREGEPRSAKEAISIVERALEITNKRFQGMRPALRPIVPATGGTHSGSATPQPKSSLDAMFIADSSRGAAP